MTLNQPPIRLIIVDDHQIVIDGLMGLFKSVPSLEVIGSTTNGEKAVKLIEDAQPDIVLLDINMPNKSGYEICAEISQKKLDSKIIALSMNDDLNSIQKIMQLGAAGYVLKNTDKLALIQAIESVYKSGRYLNEELLKRLLKQSEQSKRSSILTITKREEEVLKLVALGKQSPEIAELLNISLFTVKTHRKSILTKMGFKNSAELIRYAVQNGF